MSLQEERDTASDSDSDDEDYIPTGGNEVLSEEESGNESNLDDGGESDGDVNTVGKRKKSQKKPRKSRKKIKPVEEKENEEEKPNEDLTFEENKKRASALWEDFMKDVGGSAVKKNTEESTVLKTEEKTKEEKKEEKTPTPQQTAKVKITELFEFAGEKVEVEREVPTSDVRSVPGTGRGRGRPSGGIAGILGQMGKKGKLSTLEKSKLDWDKFKKTEGIDEEIDSFNKGKSGYLEKQDFLQRTDLRQFEIEKDMRNKRRSFNR